MCTPISPKQAASAFRPQAQVKVVITDSMAVTFLDGFVESWAGQTCGLKVFRLEGEPVVGRDRAVEVFAYGREGVYQASASLDRWEAPARSDSTQFSALLYLRMDLSQVRLEQNRACFRMPGSWSATVRAGSAEDSHPVRVWNLSIGGALIQDAHRVLGEESRFEIEIDLDDGLEPLSAGAAVARTAGHTTHGHPLWGCRFTDPKPDAQSRLLQYLQTLSATRPT